MKSQQFIFFLGILCFSFGGNQTPVPYIHFLTEGSSIHIPEDTETTALTAGGSSSNRDLMPIPSASGSSIPGNPIRTTSQGKNEDEGKYSPSSLSPILNGKQNFAKPSNCIGELATAKGPNHDPGSPIGEQTNNPKNRAKRPLDTPAIQQNQHRTGTHPNTLSSGDRGNQKINPLSLRLSLGLPGSEAFKPEPPNKKQRLEEANGLSTFGPSSSHKLPPTAVQYEHRPSKISSTRPMASKNHPQLDSLKRKNPHDVGKTTSAPFAIESFDRGSGGKRHKENEKYKGPQEKVIESGPPATDLSLSMYAFAEKAPSNTGKKRKPSRIPSRKPSNSSDDPKTPPSSSEMHGKEMNGKLPQNRQAGESGPQDRKIALDPKFAFPNAESGLDLVKITWTFESSNFDEELKKFTKSQNFDDKIKERVTRLLKRLWILHEAVAELLEKEEKAFDFQKAGFEFVASLISEKPKKETFLPEAGKYHGTIRNDNFLFFLVLVLPQSFAQN